MAEIYEKYTKKKCSRNINSKLIFKKKLNPIKEKKLNIMEEKKDKIYSIKKFPIEKLVKTSARLQCANLQQPP